MSALLVGLGLGLGLAVAPIDGACPIVLTPVDPGPEFVHDAGRRGRKHLPETMGPGLAWLDYDGDGLVDLFLVQSDRTASGDRLWRNRGDGTFEDVTARAGLAGAGGDDGYGQGVLAADLDGDSWTDLLVTQVQGDVFWRNRGDGTFEDATATSGLGTPGWSTSATAADVDGDGDLDVYVARYLDYDPGHELYCGDLERGERRYCDPSLFEGIADRLLVQTGPGHFEDGTEAAGLAVSPGKGLGAVFVDLDDDLDPDLYVANDITPNFLFQNRGDGTFEDVSFFSGAAANREGQYEAGMGIAVGDVDGDGDPDLGVTNFDVETNTLYENRGDLEFRDVSGPSGFGVPSFNRLGFGVAFLDLDLDGALDVYVANGHIFENPHRPEVGYAQPDLVLRGDGTGRFDVVDCVAGGPPLVGRGLASGDFDLDGDPDLAVAHNDGPVRLLRTDPKPGAAWLGVELRRRPGAETTVGTRLVLRSNDGRVQHRWTTAGGSYASTPSPRRQFGLGQADPSSLEVRRPDGHRLVVDRLEPLVGRYLVVGSE